MALERLAYVLKIRKKHGRLWVVFDEQHLMEGNPNETQGELDAKWRELWLNRPRYCRTAAGNAAFRRRTSVLR